MTALAFDCKRCGHCCHGEGGIIMTSRDQHRLAVHMRLPVEQMLDLFAERRGDKMRLRARADGYCVFFRQGHGCGVHPGRPDICRAWPFFRGNLVDSASWEMIQTDCPGVVNAAGHEGFVTEGLAYLDEHGLIHDAGPEAPIALVLPSDLKSRIGK